MPDHCADCPLQRGILSYLTSFAETYGLTDRIESGVEVRGVEKNADGTWTVSGLTRVSASRVMAGRWSRRREASCWWRRPGRPGWTRRYRRLWRRGAKRRRCTTRGRSCWMWPWRSRSAGTAWPMWACCGPSRPCSVRWPPIPPSPASSMRIAVERFGWTPVTRLLPRPDSRTSSPQSVSPTPPDRRPPTPPCTTPSGAGAEAASPSRNDCRPPPSSPNSPRRPTRKAPCSTTSLPLPPARTDTVLRLTREAEHRNTTDPDRAAESRRWLTGPDTGTGLGMPPEVLGPQDFLDRIPMRDFGAHRHPDTLPRPSLRETALHRRTDHRARPPRRLASRGPGPRTCPADRHGPQRPRLPPAPGARMARPARTPHAPDRPPHLPPTDGAPPRIRPRGPGHAPQRPHPASSGRRLTCGPCTSAALSDVAERHEPGCSR